MKIARSRTVAYSVLLALSSLAQAGEGFVSTHPIPFKITAPLMTEALIQFTQQSGLQLAFPVDGATKLPARKVVGNLTATAALEKLLEGSGLRYEFTNERTVSIWSEKALAKPISSTDPTEAAKSGPMRLAPSASAGADQNGIDARTTGNAVDDKPAIEEVIVTAQKREERLIEVPVSIVVLNNKALEKRGISDLKALSYSAPGMYVQETGGSQRRVSIRGIANAFGTASTIGAYLDEAPALDGSSSSQIDLPTYDLERIEVLRGPQGTLYGQGSMGGTIRYITADPDLNRFTGKADTDWSFTKQGSANQRVRGVVSVPLVEDELGIRVSGVYENYGGWIDQPALAKKDINGHESYNLRGKLLWRPTDAFELKATATAYRNQYGLGSGSDADGNYQQSINLPTTPEGEAAYQIYNVTMSYDFPGMRLLSTTSYLNNRNSFDGLGTQCCAPDPSAFQIVLDQHRRSSVFTQEVRLGSLGPGRLQWTVGGIYQRPRSYSDLTNLTIGNQGGVLANIYTAPVGFDRATTTAVFGDANYALTDKLKVGAGLRYFEDKPRSYSYGGSGAYLAANGKFTSTNPKFYLSYAVNNDIHLYASTAKGFRSGGFNDPSTGQPPFLPEKLWTYEIGTKMALLDGRLNAELALARSNYEQYQIYGQILGALSAYITNAGDAKINSIDGLLSYRVLDRMELGVSGSYIDTEFTKVGVSQANYIVGDPIDMVPKYTFSMWAERQFAWFGAGDMPGFFRVDYSNQGRTTFRSRSVAPTYFSQSDIISLLNARLGWENGAWTAELYVQNILDENGLDSPASIERLATRPWPRTVGLQLGVRF